MAHRLPTLVESLARTARLMLIAFISLTAIFALWWPAGVAVLAGDVFSSSRIRLSTRLARWFGVLLFAIASVWIVLQLPYVFQDLVAGLRSAGYLFHPNALGTSMLSSLLMLAAVADRLYFLRALAMVAASIALLLVVASGSRSILVGLLLALIAVVLAPLWARGSTSARLAVALAGLGIMIIFAAVQYLRFGELGTFFVSFERLPLYSTALDLISSAPLTGLGANAWQLHINEVEPSFPQDHAPHPHSVLLQFMIEGGVTGTVLIMVLLANWVIQLLRAESWASQTFRILAILVITALAVQSFADVTLMHPSSYIPLACAAFFRVCTGPAPVTGEVTPQ